LAIDRTKVLEAAQKHLSKGAYDKAIVELQKLVKADPSDVRTWLKIGDLYVKLNQRPQAIDTYARVADQYAGQGFFHKAVAVYKQILNLDQTRLDVKLKLAEMHESMQLTSDAMAAYEQVAAEYGRLGDADKALSTFGKMVHLDPTNIPTRIKYAEALSRAGRNEEAAAAFEAGADLLRKQGRMDDYLKVVERLLFHREDVERSRELAELYLERNDGKRALAKLQVLFKSDPKHIPTLELLARAFEQVQQLPKTISVLREISRLHGEKGNVEERARALKRIVALDPGDPEARQALAQLAGPARPAAAAVKRDLAPPPGAVIEPSKQQRMVSEPPEELEPEEELEAAADEDEVIAYVDEDADDAEVIHPASEPPDPMMAAADATADAMPGDGAMETATRDDLEPRAEAAEAAAEDDSSDVFIVEEEPVEESAPDATMAEEPSSRPSHAPRASLPPDVAREASIAKLMTEVEVFLRYGLKQKVVEQLRTVLSMEPRHVEAREKLKDLYVERGETGAAAAELVALADLFVGDRPTVALLYLRQARDLDPHDPDILQRLASLDVGASQPPPPRAPTPPPALPTPVPPAYTAPEEAYEPPPEPRVEPSSSQTDLEPPSPPTRPQPATSYLARKGAAATGPNPALSAAGKPVAPAVLPPKPVIGAPLGGKGPGRPLGSPLGSPLGARPGPIAAPKPGKPFASPPTRALSRGDSHDGSREPVTGEIALPAAPQPVVPQAPVPSPPVLSPPVLSPPVLSPPVLSPPVLSSSGPQPPSPRMPTPAPRDDEGFFEDGRTVFGAPIPEPPQDFDAPSFGEDERSPMLPELPDVAPMEAQAAPTPVPAGDPLAPISPEEFENVPLRPSTVDEIAPPPRMSLPPGEVEEILDEAEFFVAQGLFEEGIQVLRDAVAAHPKNRLLLDKIAEIEEQAARAEAAMKDASQPPPPIDNSFQLAEKLADELGTSTREGSDVLDVEEVFAQFKKGVEQQVAVDDTDTHFDLGIAYKEMGLTADAIHEFELCLVNASRECMAHTMIGLCHLEKGDVPSAIGAFKKGLYAEQKTEREELGLYFELGRAYESMRDPQEALYYYEKVKKRDPKFLNVQDRIDALIKPQRPKTAEAAPNEDLDAAFDELMGKD
jgi:tetratricopeptide (TPR) repeat protein